MGGALWVAVAVLAALKPEGCIADECRVRPMRTTGDIAPLAALALLFLAAGMAGLISRARGVRRGRAWAWGAMLALVGALTFVLGVASNAISEDLPPFFVAPGGAVLVAGLVLIAVQVARADVLPRWSAWLLLLGVLALVGVNDQNARVLLMVPFGVAWIAVGFALWRRPLRSALTARASFGAEAAAPGTNRAS